MKALGYLLISAGTLYASWITVRPSDEALVWYHFLADPWFLIGFGVGIVGVVLARVGSRSEAQAGERVSANIKSLKESIERVAANIGALDGEKASLSPYEVHGRIDDLFPDDLTIFVDARETIAHVHGLQAYADVMNEFAAGERYLNRAWSASVDGYLDEVTEYLGRAREQFESTRDKLRALKQ